MEVNIDMAESYIKSKFYVGSGTSEQLVHYETSTDCITDFEAAVNNLINASKASTTFTGTTTFEKIHVTGTSALDGKVTMGNDLDLAGKLSLTAGSGYLQYSNPNVELVSNASGGSIRLSKNGSLYIQSKHNDVASSPYIYINGSSSGTKGIKLDANGNTIDLDGNVILSSGKITSNVPLNYATIISNATSTSIATTSGGYITIYNNTDGVELATKSGKILKVTDDGKAFIDNKQLLTKAEMMDLEHPIGSIYFTLDDTNPSTILGIGTWVRIGNGMQLGVVGTNNNHTLSAGENEGEWTHKLTEVETVPHGHTVSVVANGSHDHGPGNMNITGQFGVDDRGTWVGVEGAFKIDGAYDCGAEGSDWGYKIKFNAADSWVGRTEKTGEHTHEISCGNFGGNNTGKNVAFNITNPTFAIYVWKRKA